MSTDLQLGNDLLEMLGIVERLTAMRPQEAQPSEVLELHAEFDALSRAVRERVTQKNQFYPLEDVSINEYVYALCRKAPTDLHPDKQGFLVHFNSEVDRDRLKGLRCQIRTNGLIRKTVSFGDVIRPYGEPCSMLRFPIEQIIRAESRWQRMSSTERHRLIRKAGADDFSRRWLPIFNIGVSLALLVMFIGTGVKVGFHAGIIAGTIGALIGGSKVWLAIRARIRYDGWFRSPVEMICTPRIVILLMLEAAANGTELPPNRMAELKTLLTMGRH